MRNFFTQKQPPSEVTNNIPGNAWFVEDDFGNKIEVGDQVLVTEAGATIHIDAAEDYLIEKCHAVVVTLTGAKPHQVFLLPDGTWLYEE